MLNIYYYKIKWDRKFKRFGSTIDGFSAEDIQLPPKDKIF